MLYCEEKLANSFGAFFQSKTQKIRNELCNGIKVGIDPLQDDKEFTGVYLHEFKPAFQDEIRAIIMTASPRSCELDPMPTFLLKPCLESCLALVTDIINKSLTQAVVPSTCSSSYQEKEYRNYRPVSNLSFLSKFLEKVVAKRPAHHLKTNYLPSWQRSIGISPVSLYWNSFTPSPSRCCCGFRFWFMRGIGDVGPICRFWCHRPLHSDKSARNWFWYNWLGARMD